MGEPRPGGRLENAVSPARRPHRPTGRVPRTAAAAPRHRSGRLPGGGHSLNQLAGAQRRSTLPRRWSGEVRRFQQHVPAAEGGLCRRLRLRRQLHGHRAGRPDPAGPVPALDATPSQVTLLFTSYLVVTAVGMLGTNWVSSRIGAKRTLITGLSIIVVFAALAGSTDSISGIVGFRAGWGLGNALFIATSLAVIVASASGGFAGAIVLYEAALGLGIAAGPLVGGLLGNISWRGPFFGVATL